VHATPSRPADLSYRDLGGLDLSGLDFRRADLSGANLAAADLSDADFAGATLVGARLDLAIIIRTNFSDADLSFASLVWPVASSRLDAHAREAPSFARATLRGARTFARLSFAEMRGVRLAGARVDADKNTPRTMNLRRTELVACNLVDADLAGAEL